MKEIYIYIYIPEAQKNLLKKGKKNVSIFPWRTKELFLPEHQYRILSKPLFLSLSKTFTSRRGGDKKERVPHDGEAWKPEMKRRDTIKRSDWFRQVSSLITVPPICVASHYRPTWPAFARWYMTNDLVKSVEQQTPRKGRRGRLMESNTFHACKPSSNQMARYIIPSRADIKFHELFIRILINPCKSRDRKYRLRYYREQIDTMRRIYSIFLFR